MSMALKPPREPNPNPDTVAVDRIEINHRGAAVYLTDGNQLDGVIGISPWAPRSGWSKVTLELLVMSGQNRD